MLEALLLLDEDESAQLVSQAAMRIACIFSQSKRLKQRLLLPNLHNTHPLWLLPKATN